MATRRNPVPAQPQQRHYSSARPVQYRALRSAGTGQNVHTSMVQGAGSCISHTWLHRPPATTSTTGSSSSSSTYYTVNSSSSSFNSRSLAVLVPVLPVIVLVLVLVLLVRTLDSVVVLRYNSRGFSCAASAFHFQRNKVQSRVLLKQSS